MLKKGMMSLHLVRDNNSPYYQSKAFGKLLSYIQKHPKRCDLREQAGKRSLIIKNIPNVQIACRCLTDILNENSG
jgi:transcription-repair coupling factor (superfamily II helicase)